MSTTTRPVTVETRPVVAPATPSGPAVVRWAWLGAVLLALEWVVIGKWVLGDNFVRVSSGPDVPPDWMRAVLVGGQGFFVLLTLLTLYWFLWRPWRRERRLTTDGMLVVAFLLAAPFDPLSNFGQYWFNYNSYLVNMGSIMADLPGTLSPHSAGVNEAWPVLIIPTCYAGLFIWISLVLSAIMRAARRRWPAISTARLLVVCFVAGLIVDIIIEGVMYMPLGFWTYGGGHLNVNAGHYYQYPLNEGICAAAIFTAFTALRFFTDDRGRTVVERGIDRVRGSASRKNLLRTLAVIGIVHVAFLVTYHIPQGLLALHSTQWPQDVQKRSYFTNNVCGPEVNLACPGPHTPIARPGAPRMTLDGRFITPQGKPSP